MLKRSFLFAVMLFALATTYAQEKARGTLTLTTGAAFPIGNFGNDDVSSSSSGLAKTGMLLQIGYSHPIGKNFSLAIMAHGQQNGLNTAALENAFSKTKINNSVFFSDGTTMPPPSAGTVYPNWKFDKAHWRAASLLLGGQAQLPLSSKGLYFVARLMLGPTYVSSPEINGKSVTDTATATASQSSTHAWGLGYLLGGGVRYEISSKIFFTGGLDVFGTNKITFKDITATLITTKGNPSSPTGYTINQSKITADGKQTITSINLSAGIGLRL